MYHIMPSYLFYYGIFFLFFLASCGNLYSLDIQSKNLLATLKVCNVHYTLQDKCWIKVWTIHEKWMKCSIEIAYPENTLVCPGLLLNSLVNQKLTMGYFIPCVQAERNVHNAGWKVGIGHLHIWVHSPRQQIWWAQLIVFGIILKKVFFAA